VTTCYKFSADEWQWHSRGLEDRRLQRAISGFANQRRNSMKSLLPCALAAAVLLGGSMAVFAQTTAQAPGAPQTPTTTKPPTTQAGAAGQKVTVVGCVQREEDYRKANNLGRGGVAGTTVGVGNEFVLANAMMAPSAGGGSAAQGAPTGTGGAASTTAYEVSGPNEGQLASHIGKRVEIVGMLKPAETGAAGATGGATAGAPPRGVDVVSQDLKLRELEVTSVRPATGTCPS
jgi:hypothetical protein